MTKNIMISITLCSICEGEISKPEQYKIIYGKLLNRVFWHAILDELIAPNSQRRRKIDTKGFTPVEHATETFVTPLCPVKAYNAAQLFSGPLAIFVYKPWVLFRCRGFGEGGLQADR